MLTSTRRGFDGFGAPVLGRQGVEMAKKTALGIIMFALMSVVALGIVSASPSAQSETGADPFAFLALALADAEDKGLLSDDLKGRLSDYIVENLIVPYTFETPEEARERLSAEGRSSFQFLMSVLRDANEKGVMPDSLSEVLSDWLVESVIAPRTGETAARVRERLSAQPTPTATAAPTATPVPSTVSQLVKNVEKAIVLIESEGGLGTGFIIDAGGRIVTNAHVVDRDARVLVQMHDETVYVGDVLGIDELADVAVVQMSPGRLLHPVPLGDASLVQVGDEAVAMGYPLGLKTVTSGIVSAKVTIDGVDYIQTDSAINPGNSGGPLLDGAGRVIGMNTFKYEETVSGRPVDNIGFAVAVNEIKARLESLTAGEDVLDNTPDPVPEPEPGWSRYKNGEYGYSIDVPPLWTFNNEFDDESYARFASPDGAALTEARAYEVPGSYSLRQFAEYRRDALTQAASDGSWDVFEIKSFDRVDESEDEFYLLRYRYQPSADNCVSEATERIRLSDSYPDKRYGFGMSFSICEGSLAAHIFDRDAVFATFLEWDRYASPTYGYSVNIAPKWILSGVQEAGATAVIVPSSVGGGVVRVEAYDRSDGTTNLKDFADWRDTQLYEEAEEWDEFEPHFVSNKREQVGDREAYITAYTARKSSRHCRAGYIDLVALSSYYPDNASGFVVFTGVCLFLMDDLNEDRLEMLDSFRY